MIIQVKQEFCRGCGVCMDACQIGAIFMDDKKAVIDIGLCNECEACIDACPNEAISKVFEKTPISLTPIQITNETPMVTIIPRFEQLVKSTNSLNASKPFAVAVTSFLGNIVAPRVADMAILALDRSLTKSPQITCNLEEPSHDPTHRMKQRCNRSHGGAGKGRKFSQGG